MLNDKPAYPDLPSWREWAKWALNDSSAMKGEWACKNQSLAQSYLSMKPQPTGTSSSTTSSVLVQSVPGSLYIRNTTNNAQNTAINIDQRRRITMTPAQIDTCLYSACNPILDSPSTASSAAQ